MTTSTPLARVPLTLGQKLHLFRWIIPFFGFGALCGAYLVVADRGIIPLPPNPLFFVFVAVILLILAYQAVQALRDVLAGVARVEEAVLERHWRGRSPTNDLLARFQGLGTLRMKIPASTPLASRVKYRVTYSPGSKIGWAVEPADPSFRKY